jgi:post-segregation antitoxin (ccd killing protein)
MAKRKITVTVDAATVERAQALGVQNLSAVVDAALEIHVERLARQAALRDLLESWDRAAGPVPEAEQAAARAAFDELDGIGSPSTPDAPGPAGALRRDRGQHPAVTVVDTDFALARQVGAVLHGGWRAGGARGAGGVGEHGAEAASADFADAHVVAVCARRGGGLVITSDAGDIARLAAAVPSARILTSTAR